MGGGGASLRFTAEARKRAMCVGRRKGFTGGSHTRGSRSGSFGTARVHRGINKASIGALGALRWRKLRNNCIVP